MREKIPHQDIEQLDWEDEEDSKTRKRYAACRQSKKGSSGNFGIGSLR
jgi:hypothetical protein